MYEPRTYRSAVSAPDLVGFEVAVEQTDLQVLAARDLSARTRELLIEIRSPLERYIAAHPRFAESFAPVQVESDAPEIVVAMARAGACAGVGPMAAVAGAVAQRVAVGLQGLSEEVLVENGGDLFIVGHRDRTIGLWAGAAGVKGVGLSLEGSHLPCAVATSSGRVGHSASFGAADAVSIVAADGALADAVATATANRVRGADDLKQAIDFARAVPGVDGVVVTVEGTVAAWGTVRLVAIDVELA